MNAAFSGVAQLKKTLAQMTTWVDQAVARAEEKGFDPAVLAEARLAPDQYSFVGQVLSACNVANYGAARLAGQEPPEHSNPTTIEELCAFVQSVTSHLGSFKESDFAGWESRVIPLSFMPGKGMRGEHYLYEMLVPNVIFHATLAYEILRHNGVDLGMADFLGALTVADV